MRPGQSEYSPKGIEGNNGKAKRRYTTEGNLDGDKKLPEIKGELQIMQLRRMSQSSES
jgi:hypothetical protein